MPKKQFLKDNKDNKKKSRHAAPALETADDYLAAGVDFEEAGEKWRGGDAAKSTRFFVRAVDCYDEALKKFPSSFDLAYNKARVQYELTQHPKLLAQLPGSLLDLLQTALESSRFAMSLNPDNPEVLFNTAQLLTSLVEALSETAPSESAPVLLREALGLFNKCLSIQEAQKDQFDAQAAEATNQFEDMAGLEEGGVSLTSEPSIDAPYSPPQDDRWATIVEPVTNSTLLDTVLAQLQVLTTLLPLVPSDPAGAKDVIIISDQADPIVKGKLEAYITGTGRELEAAVARGNLLSAFADACFRCSMTNLETYQKELDNAWTIEGIDFSQSPEALCDIAESLITFATSLRTNNDQTDYENPKSEFLSARFKALTTALERLTAASKLPDVDNLVKIHLLRGDVEMLRYQTGQNSPSLEVAKANETILLKNAEKAYRGAKNLALASGEADLAREGKVKELIARVFWDREKVPEFIQEMNDPANLAVLFEAGGEKLVFEAQVKKATGMEI